MCRTGPVTTRASQPLKKNIFLQSLYAEENMDVGSSRACDNGNSDTHTEVHDKEIVDCLENEVQYWTDFSKVHYHPQSLYELCGLWTDINDFNNYGSGREAFSGGLHAEEINERLRFFVEESDHPQVLLMHLHNSFHLLDSFIIWYRKLLSFLFFFTIISEKDGYFMCFLGI